jgi:hypothetical protein
MNEIEKSNQFIKLIWIALFVSPVLFFAVGHFVVFPIVPEEGNDKYVYLFMGVALLQAILSKVFYIKSDSASGTVIEVMRQRLNCYLISWALGESIALTGLILPFLCGKASIQYAYSFFIAAILLNYIHKPNLNS